MDEVVGLSEPVRAGMYSVGGLLGAGAFTLIRNLIAQANQAPLQDRELRQDLSQEVKDLRDALANMRREMDEQRAKHNSELEALHQRISLLQGRMLYFMEGRSEARAILRETQLRIGEPLTPWPEDPSF